MFLNNINRNKQNIINSVCDLITYPSISKKTNNPSTPFGENCNNCLKYFLKLADSLGFKTKNVDGYCGWVEFGQGKDLIGIIGHLDVVSADEKDWKYSPFIPTIDRNRIYGRGAIDDKGPVVSSLYAMKAVADYYNENNLILNKRVRLIVGLNEEKDWECINYYKTHEEIPEISFSPDADFPCIYAEKGVLSIMLSDIIDTDNLRNNLNFGKFINKEALVKIIDIDSANNALNVVPKYCSVTLKFSKSINIQDVINFLKTKIDNYNYDIDIYKIDEKNLKLTSYGIASHSAHPELGCNAIVRILIILNDLFTRLNIKSALLSTFCKYIGDNFTGERA